MKFTFFVHLNANSAWLKQTREERATIAQKALGGALDGLDVSFRFFDAEAFSGYCSDIAMFETYDVEAYYFCMERLRDTAIFAKPYFDLISIIPAIENGHMAFEATQKDLSA